LSDQVQSGEQAGSGAPAATRFGERVDTFCARAILAIVLLILAWSLLAFGAMPPWAFLPVEGLTVVAVALWMVRFWTQHPFRLLWPPICWAVLAFCLYAVARCQWVEFEYVARQQLIHVLVYGALFFVVLNNLNRRSSATVVSLALIALGFGMAFFAIFQFATHYPLIWGLPRAELYAGRGSGTFINPDHFAAFLGMLAPLALSFTVMSRLSPTIKVLLAYSAVTMLMGIIVSLSRGGILAEGLALAVLCAILLVQGDFWKPALVMLVLLVLVGCLYVSQFTSVQKRLDSLSYRVNDERQYYWAGAEELFARNRLWGIGPGHFDFEFPSVRSIKVQGRPQFAHNDYLNTLCDWGVAGLGIVAAACGLLYAGVFQSWRGVHKAPNEMGARNSGRAAFVVGAAAGLLALMLHCAVEFNMQIPAIALTAVTFMALLTAHWRFATERFWKNPGGLGRILLTVMAAALAGYLSLQGARSAAQWWWLDRAIRKDSVADVVACYTKAHDIEPTDWETDYHLADYLWMVSAEGKPGYLEWAKVAMTWYRKAMELNRFDAYCPLGYGMCLDLLGHTQEATPFFLEAERKDHFNFYIAMEMGRHCAALGDAERARQWFLRSLYYSWNADAFGELVETERYLGDPVFAAPK
jgi:O-antigen ligase